MNLPGWSSRVILPRETNRGLVVHLHHWHHHHDLQDFADKETVCTSNILSVKLAIVVNMAKMFFHAGAGADVRQAEGDTYMAT